MTKKTQQAVAAMAAIGMLVVGRPATADVTGAASIVPDSTPMSRVRGGDPTITAVMREAAERSATFRGLVEAINASDGIVYVHAGDCGHGVRACLAAVTVAGASRIVRIYVDGRRDDSGLMGVIGHELQHAIEVLSHRRVTSTAAMLLLYLQMGRRGTGTAFETVAAMQAGEAVRDEVRRSMLADRAR